MAPTPMQPGQQPMMQPGQQPMMVQPGQQPMMMQPGQMAPQPQLVQGHPGAPVPPTAVIVQGQQTQFQENHWPTVST